MGMGQGFRSIRREPVLGLKRILLPVSYWRSVEFAYVWEKLRQRPGERVLDLGSPKDLAFFLARHRGLEVVATDILPTTIDLCRRCARAQGMEGGRPGAVSSQVEDGRSLSFPDSSFEAAYSVSVLEHIPGSGDSVAIRELVRVVKPGGLVVLTVPYDAKHRDTYVDRPVYERERTAQDEMVFFERHYDRETLRERLVEPSGARLLDLELWGERLVDGEALLARMGRLRHLVSPVEAFLGRAFLRRIEANDPKGAMAAFLVLEKA
jgi:SAM-dependent methyltransferase